MTPERWQMVRGILQSAMELRPDERGAFLDRECASDPSLRKDVDEYLSIEGRLDPGFLESPAVQQVELPPSSPGDSILAKGTRLGNYEVHALLGAGGMGQVYRARDLLLKREVAIKVISNFYSSDPDRLHRFRQEAEATAALNHPNILTIYQVGQHDTTFYIVAELLHGDTLRDRLRAGPLPIRTATDYGVQIARGLAAAHEHGIVHRDLKPENIFVTKDGHIKILDFGLAKLVEHRPDLRTKADHDKSTVTQVTEPGLALGTTAYMSPEQVRGGRVDHHSDIFAFGAVLYEMLTGRLAFAKGTSAETMTAILNEDPPALSQSGQNIPPGLQRVIQRCLEKQPERRFQSASDLGFALEALSESGSGPAVAIRQRTRLSRKWAVAAGVVVVVTALVIAWWWMPPAVPVIESVAQLTGGPLPKFNLATDGSRIYFNEGIRGSIKIAQVSIAGGPTVPIETKLLDPALSGAAPDGSFLIAIVYPEGGNLGSLWSIPLPVGEPRRLGSAAVQNADVFPDGRLLLTAHKDVLVAESDGSNPRKIMSLAAIIGAIGVSPDGGRILLGVDKGDNTYDTLEAAADGTGLRMIRKASANECCFGWSRDGKYLVYSRKSGPRWDLWMLPIRSGFLRRSKEPVRITSGPQSYPLGAIPSRDGTHLLAVGSRERGEAVRYDMGTHQFVPLLSGISATDVTYSSDGKWVAYSTYPDHALWRSRSDGSERMQLTFPPLEVFEPFISPDGTKVVFDNMSDNSIGIVDMNGGPPKKIVENGSSPRWAPHGGSIVTSVSGTNYSNDGLRIVEVDTGKMSEIPSSKDKGGAFWLDKDTVGAANVDLNRIQIFDLRTKKWTDLVTPNLENWINSPDGKYVYFASGGAEPRIQRIRVADHHIETITSLKDFTRLLNFGLPQLRVAPDGSPTLTRDADPQQIYALNVRWP
jgi:hypothetical protein